MSMRTKKLTVMAMFIAISIVLVAIIHFPIFPAVAFLEYDPADIPIFIATFAFGPVAGLLVTTIVCIIQGFTVSMHSGVYGILMHFIATGTFVLIAGNIYKRNKCRKNAAISLAIGVLSMVAVMGLANLVITPLFMGVPVAVIQDLMFPFILPFNLIKAGVNALITFFVYKSISSLIHNQLEPKAKPDSAATQKNT